MASQFEKRQKKTPEAVAEEIKEKRSEIRAKAEPVYTQTGYDIFSPDGNRTYKVAEISYNPETKEAKVTEIFTITRLVALAYANQKTALKTLKRKGIKDEK